MAITSAAYSTNRNGPNTEPCGTPHVSLTGEDVAPSKTTACVRSVTKEVSHFSTFPFSLYDISSRRNNQGCERDLHVRDRDETETFNIASETRPRRDVHQNFTRPRRDRDVRFFVRDETETEKSQKLSETRPKHYKTILVST
jgi:hypothetical protein